MTAFCGCLNAQIGKAITIRLLDGKTGKPVEPTNYLVRVDHEQTIHANWVVQNEDGTGTLTVPDAASAFSIQATYNSATDIYVNCDSAIAKTNFAKHWYSISEILTSGVVAANHCRKPKDAAKDKFAAKPGEFVFFVRKLSAREQFLDDY
jgi:hypothetical protein